MPKVKANGLEIEYDEHGAPGDPPLLLIHGLSAQMTEWYDGFVSALAGEGFRVIRFDNRDIGLSAWFDEAGVPDLAGALETGVIPGPVYTLSDMAADAIGVLDALGVERAHIVGVSMGGMIAQTLAIDHPRRVLSLTSISSTTGNPAVGQPHPGIAETLFVTPTPTERSEYIEHALAGAKVMSGGGFPLDEDWFRGIAAARFDRSFHPAGVARQTLSVVNQPDRTEALRALACPTLVIHGDADPLVDISGGRATAEAIPNAHLWTIPGMGHELPPALDADITTRIAAHCRRAAPS